MSSTTTTTISTSTTASTTITFQTGVQYGFFIDTSRCSGCHACAVVCKSWLMLPAGPLKPLRVHEFETGSFPNVQLHLLPMTCFHCAVPACVAKANGAIYKEPLYGAVLLDPARATDPILRDAADACPYGSITFASSDLDAQATKCNMCIDRLEQGLMPACVMVCPERAWDFDTMANLQKKYGTLATVEGLPSPTTTTPSVVFKAPLTPPSYVPYDAARALVLLAGRTGAPPFYTSPTDATTVSPGQIGRTQLNLKPTDPNGPTDTSVHDEG
jgi:anaerobic dimethyl sulfoxide reductase subunit B (iron-sulfur subunit)